MRTLIVILVVDIFLGIAVESRETISSLGVLNSDIEEYLDLIAVHSTVSWSVCCVQNEGTAFAEFHQIAGEYDQSRGWVILSRENVKC